MSIFIEANMNNVLKIFGLKFKICNTSYPNNYVVEKGEGKG